MNAPQPIDQALLPALHERRARHLYRSIEKKRLNAQTVWQRYDEGSFLSFTSNDYLGLANHPQVRKAAIEAFDQLGVGSGSAHLINGHSIAHHELEQHLAAFFGRPRALLFSTGYMANLAVVTALMTSAQDTLFQDRLNHASLYDAANQCPAKHCRYRHGKLEDLRRRHGKFRGKRRNLIVTEGVFSMEGDEAPLLDLCALARESGSWLMVDDAHGIGVLGERGAGSLEQAGLTIDDVPILVGTLGKALGTFGAFVCGSDALIETCIQFSRSYVYTTASPPALARAAEKSLMICEQESWRREKLCALVDYFKTQAQARGLTCLPSNTPIQPIVLGDPHFALAVSQQLEKQGILVTAIRPPTVPPKSARLRITLSAAHETKDIDRLLSILGKVYNCLYKEYMT